MVAMLAFGGTFAYFTATDTARSAGASTGTIALTAGNVAKLNTGYQVSGQQLLKTGEKIEVALDAKTNVDTWIFVEFAASFTKSGTGTVTDKSTEAKAAIAASKSAETALTADGDYALVYAVNAGPDTETQWTEVDAGSGKIVYAFKVTVTVEEEDGEETITHAPIPYVCNSITFYGRSVSSTAENGNITYGSLMGGTINVTMTTNAIQAEGLTTAAAAWTAFSTQPTA